MKAFFCGGNQIFDRAYGKVCGFRVGPVTRALAQTMGSI
jgi:hypothetical protein